MPKKKVIVKKKRYSLSDLCEYGELFGLYDSCEEEWGWIPDEAKAVKTVAGEVVVEFRYYPNNHAEVESD